MKISELLQLRKIWIFTPKIQIFSIVVLYLLYTGFAYFEYQNTGTFWQYPASQHILFVPIYEEILFRGILLSVFLKLFSKKLAFILCCFTFGIWHLKNFPYLSHSELAYQVLYASFIFGPITTFFALKFRTIWIGVIIHYLNNILSPLSWILLAKLL